MNKVLFMALQPVIVLASAARILTELAGCRRLGQGNLRLRGSKGMTPIPEHHDRFSISGRAARKVGTRNTKWRAGVIPFFEIQKVVDLTSTHDCRSGRHVARFV